jgi:hypothetical protein
MCTSSGTIGKKGMPEIQFLVRTVGEAPSVLQEYANLFTGNLIRDHLHLDYASSSVSGLLLGEEGRRFSQKLGLHPQFPDLGLQFFQLDTLRNR